MMVIGFLGAFAKLQRSVIIFVMPVKTSRLPARMERLGSQRERFS
jgi:hypothetical protein